MLFLSILHPSILTKTPRHLLPGLPAQLSPPGPWPQIHLFNLYLFQSALTETALTTPSHPILADVLWGECRDKVYATPGEGSLQVLSVCLLEHQSPFPHPPHPGTLWGSGEGSSFTHTRLLNTLISPHLLSPSPSTPWLTGGGAFGAGREAGFSHSVPFLARLDERLWENEGDHSQPGPHIHTPAA